MKTVLGLLAGCALFGYLFFTLVWWVTQALDARIEEPLTLRQVFLRQYAACQKLLTKVW